MPHKNWASLIFQSLSGVRIPIDTATEFVLDPLKALPSPPPLPLPAMEILHGWAPATMVQSQR
ncbi:hypothetical protein [Arthrobacter sp. lap29]|uniref:hypothetical protein n=1 Tax=Arthrobacter sp. lap29 TaxID=3056122 RepID=UPI0028F73685|nr:hypothetical protein [Arthrobacter sp. lap29]